MTKKNLLLYLWLAALLALTVLTVKLTPPSWSAPAAIFVTTSIAKDLPSTEGTKITLNGGGFSQETSLWLVPEPSIRSTTTATLETYGNPTHFVRRDDNLYVANGVGRFFIVQGLHSPVPSICGVLDSGGQGMEIVLHEDEAIMAAGNSGLQIIDIRDAVNPQLFSVLKSVAPALSVASTGKIVYVAAGKNGVQIVDITDPRNPLRLGELSGVPEAFKVICREKLLIVATGRGGWIYDVSSPEHPRRLARLPVPEGTNTVMIQHGEALFWATKTFEDSRLYSLDLSQPESPRLLTSFPLSDTPSGISCSEGHVSIALGSSGTQIFSLLGDGSLARIQTIAAKNRTRFALALGRDLWVGDGGGELLRLDPQAAANLTTAAILPEISPRIPLIVTSQLFLLGDANGLAIYERANDAAPTLLARLPISGLIQQYLTVNQRQLWLAVRNDEPQASGKLISVDITIPHLPRITAEIPMLHPPTIVGESGSNLIVSTITPALWQNSGMGIIKVDAADFLHFIDTSLPESPVLFLTYPLHTSSSGISIADNLLLLMQKDGLFRVIDLTEGHKPKELGSLQMPWLQSSAWSGAIKIAVNNREAFISSSAGKIVVIDLADPTQPKNMGIFPLSGPVFSLLSSDHYLYAMVEKEGLTVIDLKNRLEPTVLGTIPLPGLTHRTTVQGGRIWYVMPSTKGIHSIPLPHRLQSSVVGSDQLTADLGQTQPGAYTFWLTDKQTHLLLPGVTWVNRPHQTR